MAATSLARQLDQLRATTIDSQGSKSLIAYHGPNILEIQLSSEQLSLLAKESFAKLTEKCPIIAEFKRLIFKDDQNDMTSDESDDEMLDEEHSLEDVLFILSPYLLDKPAQYLLQHLVSKLKIHNRYPETLFFSVLPYFEYKIFHKIVETLPVRESTSEHEDHPKWVKNFRQACHPATAVGLYRHLACDRGFFNLMCTSLVRLMKGHLVKFGSRLGVNYNNILHLFISSVVSALNLCNVVSEHQSLDLVRVIVTGLKSFKDSRGTNGQECQSVACLAFAYLIPRIQLKSKVAVKLLKVLSRMFEEQELTTDTLSLIAILYRCQSEALSEEKSTVFQLFLKHEEVIKSVMENVDRKENDEKDFAAKIQKASAVLLDDNIDSANLEDLNRYLKILYTAVAECQPTSETAEILIVSLSRAQPIYSKRLKKIKKENQDDVVKTHHSETVLLIAKILELMRKNFVEEYSKKMKLNQGKDVMFIDDEEELPTPEQIVVKKLLMDSKFLQGMMKESCDSIPRGDQTKAVAGTSKENFGDLKKLFTLVSADFIVRQIPADQLVNLVIRAMTVCQQKPKIFRKLLSFIASDLFLQDCNIQKELEAKNIDLSFLFVNQIFIGADSVKAKCLEALDSLSLSTLKTKFTELLTDSKCQSEKSLLRNLNADAFTDIINSVLGNRHYEKPHVLSFFLLLGVEWIKENSTFGGDALMLVEKILSLGFFAAESSRIVAQTEEEKELPFTFSNALSLSTRKGVVSCVILEQLLSTFQGLDLEAHSAQAQFEIFIRYLLLASSLQFRGFDSAVKEIFKSLQPSYYLLVTKVCALNLPGAVGTCDVAVNRFFDVQLAASKQLPLHFQVEKFAETIPFLLCTLTRDKAKLSKSVFKCFDEILRGERTKKGHGRTLIPLVEYLAEYKVDILSDVANLYALISQFSTERCNESVVNDVVSSVLKCDCLELSSQVLPLFGSHTGLSVAQKMSKFGLQLLDKELSHEVSNALASVVANFTSQFLTNGSDETCWNFLKRSLSASQAIVTHNNLEKSISLLTLEKIHPIAKKMDDVTVIENLFNAIVDLSGVCQSSEVLMQGRKIFGGLKGLTSDMCLKKLVTIWGDKLIHDNVSSGRFAVRSASEVDASKNWKMTLFMLETALERIDKGSPSKLASLLKPLGVLLKEALDQTEQHDYSYQLDLLLSSLLFVLDKVGADNLKKTAINPELMVRCIRTCQNPNSKATALLILAKSSASNPEYILHNSIQIFTFMGSHFLKIDAKPSFDVACQAIDVIIPHIQNVCLERQGTEKMNEMSVNILHTFADASVDMPHPHRVKVFLFKLLSRLGERDYLWMLTLLLIRKIDFSQKKKIGHGMHVSPLETRLDQLKQLYAMFPVSSQIHALHKILCNIRDDSRNMKKIFFPKTAKATPEQDAEWAKTSNILRVHCMAFANSILTSRSFVEQVSSRLSEVDSVEDEQNFMHKQLENVLEASVTNIDYFEEEVNSGNVRPQFVACCEKILEAVLSLLPIKVFVKLLASILSTQKNSVRRKMLEVFNAKLQYSEDFVLHGDLAPSLLDSLAKLSTGELETTPVNRQLALMCLRSFGKTCTAEMTAPLAEVCKKLSMRTFLNSIDNQAVRAATLLCVTELFHVIGPKAVPMLQPFISWLLDLMNTKSIVNDNAVVLSSVILSVQKCLDNFGGFLNPFYKQFLVATCKLMQADTDRDDDRAAQATKARLRHLSSTLARSVPTHKLVDIAAQCYDQLVDEGCSKNSLVALSFMLRENLSELDKSRALVISSPCLRLFQHLFNYRQTNGVDPSTVDAVESHFIETFLTLMLKLSLDDFKPIFYRIFNLSYTGHEDINGLTTMFHVTKVVAEKLRSLFSFICESLVQKTTAMFVNYSGNDFENLMSCDSSVLDKILNLLCQMLETITVVFSHNQIESLLIKNYEEHVNAILAFVEAPLEEEDKKELLLKKIRLCLGQLSESTEDETQWKYLNYQVLLNIRNSDFKIRLFVLDVVDLFLDKKGENYLAVMPDSVPLLAEALEDENSRVETQCRKLIKKMEEIFGHSVESYFE